MANMNFSYGDLLLGSLTHNTGKLVEGHASKQLEEKVKPLLIPDLFKEYMLFLQIFMIMNEDIAKEAAERLRASMKQIAIDLDFPSKLRFYMDEMR